MNYRISYYFLMVSALLSICHAAESKILETTSISAKIETKKWLTQVDSLTIQVTGKVTDSIGTVLEGVVITERGASGTARTDENGVYTIKASPNGILLVLKSPYAKKDVHINNQQQVDITLLVAPKQPDTTITSLRTSDTSANPIARQDTTQSGKTTAATIRPDSTSQDTQSTISGLVSDKSGPIANATVQVVGAEVTTTTDEQGRFTIPANSTTRLTFSSVGYTTLEQLVGDRKDVNVLLMPEVTTIESVSVVAVGYGTMNRKTLSSAVSSIGAKDIENEVLPSISQAIQGKAGGVQVTQKSGSPGGGLSIRVRGTTSINASSDPLYVVDGIPINSTTNFTGGSTFDFGGGTQGINVLSSLNPSDVQSIEILKDAASSSIYGSRAANGVVLITTKKGTAGDSQFNFNMYEGYSEVPRNRYYKMMNTQQYQDYMQDYYRYVIEANPEASIPNQILSNNDVNTDWQDAVFRNAATRNYELSASGGGEKTQYYTSLGYMRQGGVLHNSDFNRISSRINLDHQYSEKLRFSTSVNLTRAVNQRVQEENSKEGPTKSGIFSPPNLPVYNANGSYALDQVSATRENPLAILQLPTNEAETFRVLANASAEYRFIPSLALKTSFGTDISFIDETFFMPPTGLRSYTTQGGIGARRNTRDQLWINETTLTYDQTFGSHSLNLLGGVSIQESRLEFVHAQRTNFPNDDIPYIVAGGTITGANAFPEEWAIASGFARVNYTYLDKYILNANLRTDGSSRFGSDSRWATFPSLSAAWRISEEAFLKESKTLNELKIRGSWGVTGNQNIGNYASRSLYSAGSNYLGMPGFVPNILGDRNLKWETTRQWNLGVDIGLFGDRIAILADYYPKSRKLSLMV